MSLLDRFTGAPGKRVLHDELLRQPLISGDAILAEKLAAHAQLVELKLGEQLISQGDPDDDLFFILFGSFSICVHNRRLSVRSARDYVGEMSFISPNGGRSATVRAEEHSVVARISEAVLASIANEHPQIWRRLADRLVQRLRDRNQHVRPRNEIPSLFIASSSEQLAVAKAIEGCLKSPAMSVELWTNNVFSASETAIESLEAAAARADFAIVVLGPDDMVRSRKDLTAAPRDNVIFELGLFMGALGRRRTFAIAPRGVKMKIPTDLLGVTLLQYSLPSKRWAGLLRRAASPFQIADVIKPACDEVMRHVAKRGCL